MDVINEQFKRLLQWSNRFSRDISFICRNVIFSESFIMLIVRITSSYFFLMIYFNNIRKHVF